MPTIFTYQMPIITSWKPARVSHKSRLSPFTIECWNDREKCGLDVYFHPGFRGGFSTNSFSVLFIQLNHTCKKSLLDVLFFIHIANPLIYMGIVLIPVFPGRQTAWNIIHKWKPANNGVFSNFAFFSIKTIFYINF